MPADQFHMIDGRPTVRIERHYPHPIEKVWRAVTTPEHLDEWFPSPVEVELRPGGAMRFGAFEEDPAPPARSRPSTPRGGSPSRGAATG